MKAHASLFPLQKCSIRFKTKEKSLTKCSLFWPFDFYFTHLYFTWLHHLYLRLTSPFVYNLVFNYSVLHSRSILVFPFSICSVLILCSGISGIYVLAVLEFLFLKAPINFLFSTHCFLCMANISPVAYAPQPPACALYFYLFAVQHLATCNNVFFPTVFAALWS